MFLRPRHKRVVPGFGLSLGFAVAYLSIIVMLPMAALVHRTVTMGWGEFRRTIFSESVLGAYRLTLGASALAALMNVVVGLLVAWVLVRYTFPGRRFVDAVIDLPFALPTAVAGIALSFLYSGRGWMGKMLERVHFAYPWPRWEGFGAGWWPVEWVWYGRVDRAPGGVVLALMFVGLPFVVRTVQPVLQDLGRDVEEAAASLGATRWQTFSRVLLPQLLPALITGFTLAFARGLGEYGSVIFIAAKQRDTEIAAHRIIELIEQDQDGTFARATAVAVVLLGLSFVLLLGMNMVQRLAARRGEA